MCEVFFSPHYEQEVDRLALRALDSSGIRSLFVRCSNDESFFEGFVEAREEIVERSERLVGEWGDSARTHVGVGPLVPWGSSSDAFRDSVDLAGRHGIKVHLHTAETPEYNDLVRERTGKSNVGMLADSGVAPVPELIRAGVNVGLACDGPACNNGQDMIEAMKDGALLQKVVARDPEALVAGDVFAMATRRGARSVGMESRIGMLKEGYSPTWCSSTAPCRTSPRSATPRPRWSTRRAPRTCGRSSWTGISSCATAGSPR